MRRRLMIWGLIGGMATSQLVGCGKLNEVQATTQGEKEQSIEARTVQETKSTVEPEVAKATEKLEENNLKESEKPYIVALQNAITFYDANKCGTDVGENNDFDWRKACHTEDGQDLGLDLSGGYHDCGDHVKFGITQGYAASVLGWSYYQNAEGYEKAGQTQEILSTLKHFTDYLLKCHPNEGVYYYQIGDGNEDHAYWGTPEAQGKRKVIYKVDKNTAGSDVTGQASAALSLMYLNYKDIDANYAGQCLKAAKSLYVLGNVKQGTSQGQNFYNSTSYKDDLAWAAVWLYEATGEQKYLQEAKKFVDPNGTDNWTMCWDNMKTPVNLRLYEYTKEEVYLKAVKANIDYWINSVPTTKGGLKYLNEWGALRYASAEAMIAMHYYQITGNEQAKTLATSQINYILGDNPNSMSYLIGYGNKYPLYPHHRAANGYTYANGGNLKPAKHLLLGALVGGPDANDQYHDHSSEYKYTEVGIDYNAGFVGAVAAMLDTGVVASETIVDRSLTTHTTSTTNNGKEQKLDNNQIGQSTVDSNLLSVTLKNQISSSINQQYTIKAGSKDSIDLSKLKICYTYSKEGNLAQSFWCDHGGMELNSEPWYEEITTLVKGKFNTDSVEITFDGQKKLQAGFKMELGIRFANTDWSAYKGFIDKGYKVYYDGQLVAEG